MKLAFKSIFIIAFIISIYSCVNISFVQIEIIEPVQDPLPRELNNVTLIGNNLFNKDDVILPKVISEKKYLYINDSLLKICIEELDRILVESPKFSEINIKKYELNDSDTLYHKKSFDWEFVKLVCEQMNTDGIISLELLGFENTIEYQSIYEGIDEKFQVLTVESCGIWKYYNLLNKEIKEYVYIDTLFWHPINNMGVYIGIPTIDEAYAEAARIAGELYALRLVPKWTKVDRLYYISGNKEMKKNKTFVDSTDWVGMEKHCRRFVESAKTGLASKAAYNLAFVSEMNGSLDIAYEWLIKAYNISSDYYFRIRVKKYLEIIEMRMKDQLLLKNQL